MSEQQAMEAAAHAYMGMVATRYPAGTLTEVLNSLPADQRQALLDASDAAQARAEAAARKERERKSSS